MPTKAEDLVVAGHVLLSGTELSESIDQVTKEGFSSLLDYASNFQTAQSAAPLPVVTDKNWRSWINMFRVQTDISDTRWLFAPDQLFAETKTLSLTRSLNTLWIERLAQSANLTSAMEFKHPLDVLTVIGTHFGATADLASLRSYHAHWRPQLNRFPTMRHFLADVQQFRRLTYQERAISFESPFWTKVLVASLQHEYPDKVAEWTSLTPSDLFDVLDEVAATKPSYKKSFPKNFRGHVSKAREPQAKSIPHRPAVHSAAASEPSSSSAILDSAADVHISNSKANFASYLASPEIVLGLGGTPITALGRGTICLATDSGQLQLRNVYHIPGGENLISAYQLERSGFRIKWFPHQPVVIADSHDTPVFRFARRGARLVTPLHLSAPSQSVTTSSPEVLRARQHESPRIWHYRLAHINNQYATRALHNSDIDVRIEDRCPTCILAKSSRLPSRRRHELATNFLDLLHLDVGGGASSLPRAKPTTHTYLSAPNSFLLLTDDAINYRWIYFLDRKSDVISRLQDFFRMAQVQYDRHPKALRSDGGREFDNEQVSALCRNNGTTWQPSAAYAPEQNGTAERSNRTVVEATRAILLHSGVPGDYWPEAMQTVVYVQNRTPNKKCSHSPLEKAFGRRPTINHLRVFGCAAYVHLPRSSSKLLSRADEFILLGYDHENSYRVLNPCTGRVSRRRDIEFLEDHFPAQTKPTQPTTTTTTTAVSSASVDSGPSYSQALSGPDALQWRDAVENELSAITAHDVWDLVPRSTATGRIMSNRWVFKRKDDGSYKARLVIRGFTEDVNDRDVYADVIHCVTMRLLFAYAAHHKLHIRHADISTAFLHAPIEEDLYMAQPQGLNKTPGMVCKLKRALYGLRSAPRRWQLVIRQVLNKHGFVQLNSDANVFRRADILLSVYVDDLAVFGPDEAALQKVILALTEDLRIKDLGPMSHYLGMKLSQQRDGTIQSSHQDKIIDLATRYNLAGCRSTSVPLGDDNLIDSPGESLSASDHALFRSAVGSLLHIAAFTRPDISYAIGRLSRKLAAPTTNDRCALMHVIRYLWHSQHLSLTFRHSPTSASLSASSDSSWGTTARPHSISGIVLIIGDTPIYWASKRQTLIALSTCEAECNAASHAAREIVWIKALHEEVFGLPPTSVPLHMDNKSAILTADGDGHTSRNRHYVMHHGFLRQCVSNRLLHARYIPTDMLLADGFTKALALPKHTVFLNRMQLQPFFKSSQLSSSTKGGGVKV